MFCISFLLLDKKMYVSSWKLILVSLVQYGFAKSLDLNEMLSAQNSTVKTP